MLRVKRPLKTSRLARHLLFQQRQVGTDIRMSAIELRSTSVTGRRARSDVEPTQSTHCRRSMRRGCGGSFQGTTAIQSVTLAGRCQTSHSRFARVGRLRTTGLEQRERRESTPLRLPIRRESGHPRGTPASLQTSRPTQTNTSAAFVVSTPFRPA